MDFKKHSFWIAMGGAGAAIVIFYVIFVMSAESQADTFRQGLVMKQGQLKTLAEMGANLPNEKYVTANTQHKAEVEGQRKEVKKFYIEQGDARLESWFDDLKGRVPAGGQPTRGDFVSLYKDNMDRLVKYLQGEKIEIGTPGKKGPASPFGGGSSGGGEGTGFEIRDKEVTDTNMKSLQKHYWIQKRLADVMVQSKVTCFEKIEFTDDTRGGGAAAAAAKGNALPHELGTTIPFELQVYLLNSDVPKLVANVLKFDAKSLPIMTRIKSIRIRKTQTPLEEKKTTIAREEFDKPDHKKPRPDPIPVKVILVAEVLDFDIQNP